MVLKEIALVGEPTGAMALKLSDWTHQTGHQAYR